MKKSKQHAGMCKQMHKPQESRKNPSARHSRGEGSAEIVWTKEYVARLERDQGRAARIFWNIEKRPERKDCCEALQHREGKARQGYRLLPRGSE